MNTNDIRFWERLWQDYREASPQRRRRRTKAGGPLNRWNKMAADFARHTHRPDHDERRRAVVADLVARGALAPGFRVLDIGAGPGAWARLLAETAAEVTALEPADAMADILEANIREAGAANIRVVRRTWQSVDLDAEGWRGAFDLVFASMSPGIDGPAALYKMMAAGRRWCYLSAFAGRGPRPWHAELWREFFDEPLGSHPSDIVYPFNLVYALGYRPRLEFAFWDRERTWDRDEALRQCTAYIEDYLEPSPEVAARVAAFVDRHMENGTMTRKHRTCHGMMTWNLDERPAPQ